MSRCEKGTDSEIPLLRLMCREDYIHTEELARAGLQQLCTIDRNYLSLLGMVVIFSEDIITQKKATESVRKATANLYIRHQRLGHKRLVYARDLFS